MVLNLDLNTVVQGLIVVGSIGAVRGFNRVSRELDRLGGRFDEHAQQDAEMFRTISHRLDSLQVGRYLDKP